MGEPFFVKLAGQVWRSSDADLLAAEADLATGKRASSAQITLADPRFELANSLPLPTRDTRVPLEVFAGAGRSPTRLFAGFVSRLVPSFPSGRVHITATDKLKGARRKKAARARAQLSVLQLAKKLAKDFELTLDTSQADRKALGAVGRVLQHGETDFALLERLCDLAGHVVWVDADALRIVDEAREVLDAESVLELRLGSSDIRGEVRFDITERTTRDATQITDYKGELFEAVEDDEGNLATYTATELERTGVSVIDEDSPGYTDQAIAWQRKALGRSKRIFETTIETSLTPNIKPREVVALRGFGKRFDGLWRVDRVRHVLGGASSTRIDIFNGGAA